MKQTVAWFPNRYKVHCICTGLVPLEPARILFCHLYEQRSKHGENGKKFRKIYPENLIYGCSAHSSNLVTPISVIKYLIQVFLHIIIIHLGDKMAQLSDGTRNWIVVKPTFLIN